MHSCHTCLLAREISWLSVRVKSRLRDYGESPIVRIVWHASRPAERGDDLMGKRIALIFEAAVAIGTGPAFAADLLPPPPPIEIPPGDFSGWYLRGDRGVALHRFSDLQDVSVQPAGGFGFADDKNQTNLAWAVMAGLGYTINPRLKLELGYRYLNMGTIKGNQIVCQGVPGGCPLEQQTFKVSSHDFRLGMRWMFNDLPPPLIRKILNGQKQVLRNAGSGPRFCLGGRLS